jgi:hypothetical protein
MPFRPLRALTVLLMLTAAFPPPAVVNLWIADAPLHDSSDAKKEVQARGRNRIGSPFHLDSCQALAPIDGGKKRPDRPSWFLPHQDEPTPRLLGLTSASPTLPTTLRLRC